MRRRVAAFVGLLAITGATQVAAQVPEKFENLKVLPKDITREQLLATMRSFSLGLGVRCEYCHEEKAASMQAAPGRGGPDLDFKSDKKPTKERARFMLGMVRTINDTLLAKLQNRADPPVRVGCVTCHRGSPLPRTLDAVLAETITKQGVDSAIAQYRKLRDETMVAGRYNFGELTLSDPARALSSQGKHADAIRLLELNQEFFPQSAQIDFQMAETYRAAGDTAKAIERYKKTLEKQPNNAQAKRRLTELGVQ